MKRSPVERDGYLLLEFIPVLSVAVVLLTITILALNPQKHFQDARNDKRQSDIALIADAIVEYTRDHDQSLINALPLQSQPAKEICADHSTGSCSGLFSLTPLLGTYLVTIPIDPQSQDNDRFNEHSRYFIVRTSTSRFTISAPDTEPVSAEDIAVSR